MEMILNISCTYCSKRLVQPTVKDHNRNYHLDCYIRKNGSKIFTESALDDMAKRLDDMGRRIEFLLEISDNALDNKSSLEEQKQKFQEICTKYADLTRASEEL
jgi:hypothetical protein